MVKLGAKENPVAVINECVLAFWAEEESKIEEQGATSQWGGAS